jgi:hypothetical protein
MPGPPAGTGPLRRRGKPGSQRGPGATQVTVWGPGNVPGAFTGAPTVPMGTLANVPFLPL